MSEELVATAELHGASDSDSRETVAVAASVLSLILGALYWVARFGFDNPVLPVIESVGLAMFVAVAPLWLTRLADTHWNGRTKWWLSQSMLALVCLAVMTVMGFVSHVTELRLAPLLAIPGGALAVFSTASWVRRGRVLPSILFLLGVGAFGMWAAGVVWGSRYKMPLYWEMFSLNGNVHHDPVYYASMFNMLDTYGIVSTGIDGLQLIRYHFGSAWILGNWGHLLGIDVLSFYSLGYPVIVIPLFFSAILLLALQLRSVFFIDSKVRERADWRIWLVFLAATIGLIPTDALDGLAIWNSNVLISESYFIAVPVVLLVAGVIAAFSTGNGYRTIAGNGATSSDGWSAPVFLLAFLPMALVIAGILKLSLMLLLLGTLLYAALRLGLWRNRLVKAGIVVCVGASALTHPVVAVAAQNAGVSPLNFMLYNVADGWQQFFPLLNLGWTWLYIAGRVWEEDIRTVSSFGQALSERRLVDAELVFVVALLGFLPGQIFSIHGGSAIYFSDVQRWVALGFIVSRLGRWSVLWRKRNAASQTAEPARGWQSVRLSKVLLVLIAVPCAITLALNASRGPLRVLHRNMGVRTQLAEKGGGADITNAATLRRGLRLTKYYPLVTTLRGIARLSPEERQQAALFIPQSYTDYWNMFDADNRCTYVSLVAPALSGVALIDGMPPFGCDVTDQYNMKMYRPRTAPQDASDRTPEVLCDEARRDGFAEVLVLQPDAAGQPRISRLSCQA